MSTQIPNEAMFSIHFVSLYKKIQNTSVIIIKKKKNTLKL